jgi:hypothetical protein
MAAAGAAMIAVSACSTLPGPYNGIVNTPEAAVTKIGCFKYVDNATAAPVLSFNEANLCEDQAIKCQLQQNRQSSGFTETLIVNGAVSAGAGAAGFTAQANMLGYAAKVATRFPAAGAAAGAIGSVNSSSIIYSQAQTNAVAECAKQFLGYWKETHKGEHGDIFITAELVRSNIAGNVVPSERSQVRYH